MSLRLCGLLGLLASACLWAGAKGSIEVVRDPDVLEFAQRIELFYDELEGRSINVFHTFQDPVFRAFFLHEEGFVDYYASLASQLRAAHFRHGRPVRVEIREFRLGGPDRATVDVTFSGRHVRVLRFWKIEVHRTDTWLRSGTTWVLSPKRL